MLVGCTRWQTGASKRAKRVNVHLEELFVSHLKVGVVLTEDPCRRGYMAAGIC